jgi:predicted nuclease of predicted toxin-antitoxin system
VKLLFDENVSHRLAETLADVFPGSLHVRRVGLRGMEDRHIWEYARNEGFAIVSKDTDFRERGYVEGAPPKVVWLDVGNAGTKAIEQLLRREHERVGGFAESEESSVLILSLVQNAV